ncbi:MAG: uncharacterized protein KVP18_001354 [Porospora cf. gigantea A]|uniref:uncharacterized protein n=1 Tax=Porospora cf. gigantea A TaxID=2853593 RepID=UPI00355AB30D|nr:MAG: hypothetical protein KVP18_001354 [Porospora cf. gigantea A]
MAKAELKTAKVKAVSKDIAKPQSLTHNQRKRRKRKEMILKKLDFRRFLQQKDENVLAPTVPQSLSPPKKPTKRITAKQRSETVQRDMSHYAEVLRNGLQRDPLKMMTQHLEQMRNFEMR